MNTAQPGKSLCSEHTVFKMRMSSQGALLWPQPPLGVPSNSQHYNQYTWHLLTRLDYEFLPTSPLGPALSVTVASPLGSQVLKCPPPKAPFSSLPWVVAVGLREKKNTWRGPQYTSSLPPSTRESEKSALPIVRDPSQREAPEWHLASCSRSSPWLTSSRMKHRKVWSGHPEDTRVPGGLRAPHEGGSLWAGPGQGGVRSHWLRPLKWQAAGSCPRLGLLGSPSRASCCKLAWRDYKILLRWGKALPSWDEQRMVAALEEGEQVYSGHVSQWVFQIRGAFHTFGPEPSSPAPLHPARAVWFRSSLCRWRNTLSGSVPRPRSPVHNVADERAVSRAPTPFSSWKGYRDYVWF